MAKLFYQGHGSFRITTDSGTVIYVDPYAGSGYDLKADIILVSHQHHDHNNTGLVPQKEACRIISEKEALMGGKYNSFKIGDVLIEAVPAYNNHHNAKECVGFIICADGISLYAAGDTSKTDYMKDVLSKRGLDYALLPTDGIYNMNTAEASECAAIINAKFSIPIHMVPGGLFDRSIAETFHAKGRIIIEPGETIKL